MKGPGVSSRDRWRDLGREEGGGGRGVGASPRVARARPRKEGSAVAERQTVRADRCWNPLLDHSGVGVGFGGSADHEWRWSWVPPRVLLGKGQLRSGWGSQSRVHHNSVRPRDASKDPVLSGRASVLC